MIISPTTHNTCDLLFWKITETKQELVGICTDKNIDCNVIDNVKSDKRACEILAVQLLINHYFNDGDAILSHTQEGAPFIIGKEHHISITHSQGIVALAVSRNTPIGIDIEINSNKILKVRDKFLNEEEKAFISPNDILGNQKAWSAKEAVYKVASIAGLDLAKGIQLNESISSAIVCHNGIKRSFDIAHITHNEHAFMVTIATPQKETT